MHFFATYLADRIFRTPKSFCPYSHWVGIFDHIFNPKRDNLLCPVIVFHRGISNGISDFILKHFMNIPLQFHSGTSKWCSTLSLAGCNFIFPKNDGSIGDLGGKFKQKQIYLFWVFWSLILNFLCERGNHEEHPQSKCPCISAVPNSFLSAGIKYMLSRKRNFSLAFIFLKIFDTNASPLNFESSWQPRYSAV